MIGGAGVVALLLQTSLGPSVNIMGANDDDISGSCLSGHHFTAVGAHFSQALRGRFTVQAAARGYVIDLSPSCVDGLIFPRPDGTYDVEHPDPLQSQAFLSTDVRIGVAAPNTVVALTLGGGNNWRTGYDAPYGLLGLGFPVVDGVRRRFGVQIEYVYMRLTTARTRQTWQGGIITDEESLSPSRHWAGAVIAGVRWGFRL